MIESNERRKRRRWGDAAPSELRADSRAAANDGNHHDHNVVAQEKSTNIIPLDAKAKAAALQQSISARLAALKAKKAQSSTNANANAQTPTTSGTAANHVPIIISSQRQQVEVATAKRSTNEPSSLAPPAKKAKIYDLDLTVSGPTFRKKPEEKKKINPYLSHHLVEQQTDSSMAASETEHDDNDDNSKRSTVDNDNYLLDSRLAGGQIEKKRRKKELHFVEPGTFIQRAERRREKVENATKSGFVSGRKLGLFVKPTGMADVVSESEKVVAKDDYYGQTASNSYVIMEDFSTLAQRVPRVDTVNEASDGSSKGTGGVVVIPTPLVMEWWDLDLLPTKLKKEVISFEGKAIASKAIRRMKLNDMKSVGVSDQDQQEDAHDEIENWIKRCSMEASVENAKTYRLVQHPVPVKPPNAPKEPVASTLHLTKKEMKRQRKLRRAEKQRELQDMQAAGLIPAPEPKLTLSNFMKVLGDQAVMDPSKMEAKVMEQIQARKLKHEKMNAERKLTKEQRAEKRDKKLSEDTSHAVSVALFLVKDMSHRYHRTKVDLNAQQNKITGGVVECQCPSLSLVICEGGPKAIKRFTRLMTVRMNWTGEGILNPDDGDDDDVMVTSATMEDNDVKTGDASTSQKFNPENSCELVWTGMAPKRMFRTFVFQTCESSDDARRILEAKGVAHFWDQVLVHASGSGETFNFKLGVDA
eukprot:CAMPEP_0176486608 /NCGR_PEP_ID=MMETSP0200_2-20121128/5660_1 /TAXON_ID=947934 /ORGANISM="Chaetoceros sp., Strain GSL56" /LENGTH=698 /DNA_ID=CAMNT_0017883323 /DNA_START=95 /DNA_END=2191 /DNA_ORIENTATION=+